MNNDDSWEEVEVPENQEVDYEIEEEVLKKLLLKKKRKTLKN